MSQSAIIFVHNLRHYFRGVRPDFVSFLIYRHVIIIFMDWIWESTDMLAISVVVMNWRAVEEQVISVVHDLIQIGVACQNAFVIIISPWGSNSLPILNRFVVLLDQWLRLGCWCCYPRFKPLLFIQLLNSDGLLDHHILWLADQLGGAHLPPLIPPIFEMSLNVNSIFTFSFELREHRGEPVLFIKNLLVLCADFDRAVKRLGSHRQDPLVLK